MKSQIKQEQNLINIYKSKKPFNFIDAIIIAVVLIAIVLCFVFSFPTKSGSMIEIYHEGKEIGIYPLETDRTISILENNMTIVIENGYCYVQESNCMNKICVHSKEISKSGERIVCAPNKVTIIVKSDQETIITGGAS